MDKVKGKSICRRDWAAASSIPRSSINIAIRAGAVFGNGGGKGGNSFFGGVILVGERVAGGLAW